MSKLDLEWLSVFEEIFQTRSVSRAAEHLGIAQATASIALSKLRAHFGDKLFSRTSQGMQPTAYATQVRPSLKLVLETLEQARSARVAFDPASSTRTFRICMTDIRQLVMLPVLVNHLKRVAPQVSLEVETISPESPHLMEDARLDLAVGYMPHIDSGFFQRTLLDEDFVCMVSEDHPRVGARLGRKAFMAEGHILVGMSGTGPSIVDRTLAELAVQRHVALRMPTFLGVARVVAQTELLVVVPRSLGEAFADQERVRLLASPIAFPSYSVKLHWHERFHADAGNVWLRQVIAALFLNERRREASSAGRASTPVRRKRA